MAWNELDAAVDIALDHAVASRRAALRAEEGGR
jgi:hypothetical protein